MYSTNQVKCIYSIINRLKSFSLLLFFLFLLSASKTDAQEFRLSGSVQILGEINGAFTGFGLGLENPLGKHFSLSADVNAGYSDKGRALAIRPAIHYFLSREQKGFYIGPSVKYIHLKERLDYDRYQDELFAVGFSLGAKSKINDRLILTLDLSPHKTLGGNNEADVAGISGGISIGYRIQ